MTMRPDEERAYLLRRSENHRRLAANCPIDGQRALHEKFAALYAERADGILVQDN